MASVRDMGMKDYCDTVYNELSSMKERTLEFADEIDHMQGPKRETLLPHAEHFRDIARMIEWKLEILTKVCPFDWAGYKGDVEKTSSVQLQEETADKEAIAGGYLGG